MNITETLGEYSYILDPVVGGLFVIIAAVSAFIILWYFKYESEETSKADLGIYVLLLVVIGVLLIDLGHIFYYYVFVVTLMVYLLVH